LPARPVKIHFRSPTVGRKDIINEGSSDSFDRDRDRDCHLGAFGFQTREKVLDVGPIHASKDKEHNVPYGPLAGAVLAVGGVVLLVKGKP
jgi:hypothetical protein